MAERYEFKYEAQRIIDAIEPRAGAMMTLLCALHEAYDAGAKEAGASEKAEGEVSDRQQQAERLLQRARDEREDAAYWRKAGANSAAVRCDLRANDLEAGASALAREQEMVEALRAITADMDRAGGDAHGMPECPWCKAGPHGDDHRGDCELSKARAVLAKAEIPHD